jgi:hypothetical protein
MKLRGSIVTLFLFFLSVLPAQAQRNYAPHSVLAAGNWYKVGVRQEGVYKVDLTLFTALGVNTSGLSSASIRLFGNGGAMLDEHNATPRPDDLYENPIEVFDGGDGSFNGTDYFVFYAPGPHHWEKDSANQLFRHRKNLFSDTAWYYITIGGAGKRVPMQPVAGVPTVSVNSYNERYFYENDRVNFLNSGKEWYGEEFNSNPAANLSRSFSVDWQGLQTGHPLTLVTDLAGRSVGTSSGFLVRVNGQNTQSVPLPAITGQFMDAYASTSTQRNNVNVSQAAVTIAFTWSPAVSGAQGWLNWFELHGRRSLVLNGNNSMLFRDWQSVQPGAVARYTVGNAAEIWETTDPLNPVKMNTTVSGSQLVFDNDASRLREYAAFAANTLLVPLAGGKIANQDLHNTVTTDFIIVTHNTVLAEAQRLADFHKQHDGHHVTLVTTEQVYQEFSGGSPDPVAIRDFVKMYFDKAGTDVSKRPRYLLLFGTGSYDYRYRVNGNVHLVPVYESSNSLDPLNTYSSDDFFALLNDTDDINRNDPAMQLDIGVGRIPARSATEAKTMVDKIIRYHTKQSLGAWRNQTVFVADDRDNNLHLTDAESNAVSAMATNPLYNQDKIYFDAYPVVSGSGGARYPVVNDAIVSRVFDGTLILNYTGHGSYQRWAEEAVLTQEELKRFNNPDKLPLFITATCDFAPHDDPVKNSLGAEILTGSSNGAIALLTTTRVVFAFSNRQINDSYLRTALERGNDGKYLTLGESIRIAKNLTMQNTGDVVNNRKFTLLGDPAMRLGFPELKLELTSLNNQPIGNTDTLRALGKYTFKGRVTDALGSPVADFNGKLTPVVFDKAQQVKTRANDPASPVTSFAQQTGILYKGDVSITNGEFSFSFIVPKDISFQAGKGRISLYADDGNRAANGVITSLYIGGVSNSILADNEGPVIQPYINDDKFQEGGLTNENPVLLVKLSDSSGISTSGNAIGHDITAVIDGNERNVLVLNAFYTADRNSYQSGQVLYQLPGLAEGRHTIRIKAWDVANNSSESTISFVVARQEKLQVTNIRNFPNPFQTTTTFGFEHNQPNTNLDVTIDIHTSSGAFVKRIHQTVNTGGSRNCQINWKGDNQAGAKLPKGVYIYRVIIVAGGQQTESSRQLIIL